MPNGYSKTQIRLHWVIFILILLQFAFHEPIAEGWDIMREGGRPDPNPLVLQHVIGGLVILALVLWRIRIRTTRGAPALPAEEPMVLKGIAHLTHFVLYALMVLMPVSGAIAFFGQVEAAGKAHEFMRILLLLFALLHILGALYQQFVLKTNIMDRMRTADPD